MTNGQLVDLLQKFPSELEVVVIDWANSKPKLKSCSRIDKRIIVDKGIDQEYILLAHARSFDCVEPIGVMEE